MKDPSTPTVNFNASALDLKRSPKSATKGYRNGLSSMGRSSSSTFLLLQRAPAPLRRRTLLAMCLAFIVLLLTALALRDGWATSGQNIRSQDLGSQTGLEEKKVEDSPLDLQVDAEILHALDSLPGHLHYRKGLDAQSEKKKSKKHKAKQLKKRKRDSSHALPKSTEQSALPRTSLLSNPLEPLLPPRHPCANFTLPPPPKDPKRSGPRACPVCYLPEEEASELWPDRSRDSASPLLKELTFVTEADVGEQRALSEGKRPRFAGHQTLTEREQSFHVSDRMHVHCGFVSGGEPGADTGFDFSTEDRAYMHSCKNVVVTSAIFGAYDVVQQPSGVSPRAKESACFVMFVDEVTHLSLVQDGTLPDESTRHVGLWRLVVVTNLPYRDPRRTGKIPKLLVHRLFPNAQFAIWVDAKLELRVDPIKLLERFLWRGNFTWAISKHYVRFDVFEEAERNKAAGKYNNASIDEQVEVYRREGMTPYSDLKLPIISDVPEGCVILRELTPLTNLLACTWFNEVDRFTSRDQLSFGFCRDKMRSAVKGWNVNMFLDCERRNFVVQKYHKELLKTKFNSSSSPKAEEQH